MACRVNYRCFFFYIPFHQTRRQDRQDRQGIPGQDRKLQHWSGYADQSWLEVWKWKDCAQSRDPSVTEWLVKDRTGLGAGLGGVYLSESKCTASGMTTSGMGKED